MRPDRTLKSLAQRWRALQALPLVAACANQCDLFGISWVRLSLMYWLFEGFTFRTAEVFHCCEVFTSSVFCSLPPLTVIIIFFFTMFAKMIISFTTLANIIVIIFLLVITNMFQSHRAHCMPDADKTLLLHRGFAWLVPPARSGPPAFADLCAVPEGSPAILCSSRGYSAPS